MAEANTRRFLAHTHGAVPERVVCQMSENERVADACPGTTGTARTSSFETPFRIATEVYVCVMARRIIPFPRPAQPDFDGPIEWATFQVGADRMVIDLRGPEPKFRTDPAEVIAMGGKRKRSRKKNRKQM